MMVDTVKPQLAELWQGNMRIGYALAVDGKLIDGTMYTTIETEPGKPMVLRMDVRADDIEQIRIDLREQSTVRHG